VTKVLSAQTLELALAKWASDSTNPNTAALTGAKGSYYLRAPTVATGERGIYQNLSGTATGWVHQNLININVFDPLNFGAVGDGVTDDTSALWACIQAANAAGGGIVYFRAGKSFRVGKRLTTLASFNIANMANLLFLGDGYASKILMIGDGTHTDWYLFYLHDGSQNIRFHNFYMDGAGVTNADEQTHLVFFAGENADTHGGAHDCAVDHCYFGTVNGDNVRVLGVPTATVSNIRVEANSINSPACRSGVAAQRYTYQIVVRHNFLTGSDDQDLDFEPTGGTPPDNVPAQWIISGNQFDHGSKNVVGITLDGTGSTDPTMRSMFCYNGCHNQSDVEMRDASKWLVHGNVSLYTAALGGDIGLNMTDGIHDVEVSCNIFDRPNRTTQVFRAIIIQAGSSTRERVAILNNIGQTYGDATGGIGIGIDSVNDCQLTGNLIAMSADVANLANGIRANVTVSAIDGIAMIGNMVIATNQALLVGISFGTTGAHTFGNALAYGNFIKSSGGSGVRFALAGGGTFVDWRAAIDNNCTSSGSNVLLSGFTSGVTVEGNAGPSARMLLAAASPAGAVPSVVGSLAVNTAGGNSTTLWVKESAASATDTAGWVSNGPTDLVFAAQSLGTATADRYLAPGMDLASASSVEIELPVPRAGTIRELRLQCVAGTGAANVTFTLRKNGVDTALALTVSNLATGGVAAGSIAFAAGDRISVRVSKTAIPTTPQTLAALTLEFSS
jgi:hypothetical protein